MCVHVCVHVHVCACACVRVCVHVCICVCLWVCILVCIHRCVYILHIHLLLSLLNILAGRNTKGVTGVVTFSGDRIPHNFSRLSGFVTAVSIQILTAGVSI